MSEDVPLNEPSWAHKVGDDAFDRFAVVPYQDRWPADFLAVARLVVANAPVSLRRVDHVGSTSVAGLPSKDRIDVQVTVEELGAADLWDRSLGPLGFSLEPALGQDRQQVSRPGEASKHFLHRSDPRPFVNLHERAWHRENWTYAILFRDFLRANPATAQAYGEAKTRLAEVTGGERSTYSFVKEPVCDIIFAAAQEWAGRVGWSKALYEASNVADFV